VREVTQGVGILSRTRAAWWLCSRVAGDALDLSLLGPVLARNRKLRSGLIDKFPLGAVMNRGLTLRSGRCHVHRYLRPLLQRIEDGEIDPSHIVTHRLSLSDGPSGYEVFKHKQDEWLKVVLTP
jgi:threonine dehydrogenase-like Zn-dependent dehydrogenase